MSLSGQGDMTSYSQEASSANRASKESYFLNALGHVTPAMPKSTEVADQDHHDHVTGRKRFKADCDVDPLDTTPAPDSSSNSSAYPLSYSWRLRISKPCKSAESTTFHYQWDLYNVEFFSESCPHASTAIAPTEIFASGQTDVHLNKELAFDGDPATKWQGKADENDKVWIEARFSNRTSVKCVKFLQCDCPRSARSVVLTYIPDDVNEGEWLQALFTPDITWGEESTLNVLP